MVLSLYAVNIFLFILFTAFVFLKLHFSYWKRHGIPHDKPYFPGGNIDDKSPPSESIRQNYKKYKSTGPFGGFFINLHRAVILYDLDLIKNVLVKDFHNFPERGLFHNERDDPLTGNLFRLDAVKWKPLRSQLSPSFSGIKLKDMFITIVQIGQKLVQTFDDVIGVENSSVDINDIIARFITDVNGNCVFGLDFNSLNDKNADFFRTIKSISGSKLHSKTVNLFISSFPKLAQKLRLRLTHDDLNDFFIRIVRETIEYREKDSIKHNDFLSLMIELKNTEGSMSLEQISGQTYAYFSAGFENSTATIVMTLIELALNQDVQDKLREEITNRMEKYRQKLTFDCMMEMHYMRKVVKESLRKHPVVPYLLRLAKNDYPTAHSKYIIPSETLVVIPIEAIQNDPDVYPNPKKFDPERFRPEEIHKRNNAAWLPFGVGPRHCIGLRFAKLQIYVAVILLVRHYRFDTCSELSSIEDLIVNKKPSGQVCLSVERI